MACLLAVRPSLDCSVSSVSASQSADDNCSNDHSEVSNISLQWLQFSFGFAHNATPTIKSDIRQRQNSEVRMTLHPLYPYTFIACGTFILILMLCAVGKVICNKPVSKNKQLQQFSFHFHIHFYFRCLWNLLLDPNAVRRGESDLQQASAYNKQL